MKLLNIDANPKLNKGKKKGYISAGLHLAPANLSGRNVCPGSSEGCRNACLNTAGMGGIFRRIQNARMKKTKWFFEDKASFMRQLEKEIQLFINSTYKTARKKKKKRLIPVVRLNVLSDINWSKISFVGQDGKKYKNIMERFPDIQFYDYTKMIRNNVPDNYHLTFSLSESNDKKAKEALKKGMNLAVVFKRKPPKKFWNYKIFDGDETDLRFLDPPNRVIALKAKGKARKDISGFVK